MSTPRIVWYELETLTSWLRRAMYALAVVDVIQVADAIHRRNAFQQAIAHGMATTAAIAAIDKPNVWVETLASTSASILVLLAGIFSLVWIFRIAANLRVLGVRNLAYGPGWTVLWFFIPFANLWKPYQAMKEIWQASDRLQSWRGSPVPALLPAWWALWLLTSLAPFGVNMAAGLQANATGQWLGHNAGEILGSLTDIPAVFAFASLMGRLWRMQAGHAPPKLPTLPTFEAAG